MLYCIHTLENYISYNTKKKRNVFIALLSMLALSTSANAGEIPGVEVTGNTIEWDSSKTGWVQVQDNQLWNTVPGCSGEITSCEIPEGYPHDTFSLTDHTNANRSDNLVVQSDGCEVHNSIPTDTRYQLQTQDGHTVCDSSIGLSVVSAKVNDDGRLDVVLNNPMGAKIDAHLSMNPQPNEDGTYANELGDTVSIGAADEFTFGNLPAGQYNAYLRVRYTLNNFSDNDTTVADGRFVDQTISVGIQENPKPKPNRDGYVSILDLSGPDRARGSISDDDFDSMVNPLNSYWADNAVNSRILSTETRSGKRALAVRLTPTPTDKSGTDRFAAGLSLREFPEKEMWLSQYIQVPSGHDFKDRGKIGMGLFAGESSASGGNPKPNGASLRVIWRVYNGVGNWGLYLYTGDQPSNSYGLELYDLDGNSTKGTTPHTQDNLNPIQTGVWVHHETRIKLNTANNKNDGILQHWIDGVLVKDLNNVQWLTEGKLNFLAAVSSNFYGGTNTANINFAPNGPQNFYLADWALKRVP